MSGGLPSGARDAGTASGATIASRAGAPDAGTASDPLGTAARAVADVFAGVRAELTGWRDAVAAALREGSGPLAIDELVTGLALPRLVEADALLIGAGFVAAPGILGEGVGFAWWLGPLDDGPIFGPTDAPSRLDLTTRGYADYLRDVRALEWYAAPVETGDLHVTGPYVDLLCTCDSILTITLPVPAPDGSLAGVVGADVALARLERELVPTLLGLDADARLVAESGRVVVSTDPRHAPGRLAPAAPGERDVACAGAPFRLVAS